MKFRTKATFREKTSDLKKEKLPREAVLQERIWVHSESQQSESE